MPKLTFVDRNGKERQVDAPLGLSVMEVAVKNGVDIEAACEGSLACATCHLVASPETYEKLPPPSEDEEDMLDFAFGLTRTSRLSCQIRVSEALDGAVFTLPDE
ncbi:MAG: 2Fe-2S iron-sulfur cluster-binding protein [Pseudomonadota bacterium]